MTFSRIITCFLLCICSLKIKSVRPFITDDARVVGWRLFQYETWLRFDEHAWQHWSMFAYGPSKHSEIALGFVHGVAAPQDHKSYSYAIPLLQVKYLINEYKPNKLPGVAVAAGTFLPGGDGAFKAPGYGGFAYVAVTQCFGQQENILIHGNLGFNYVKYPNTDYSVMTWGVGTQIKTIGGLHVIGELFSGDPYVPGSGIAFQTGFRHIVSNYIQLDFTIGQGISGTNQLPLWYGGGVRLVTDWFEKRHKRKHTDTN